ncbi:MAG: MMPL family transporter [Treponema sp.]|nr:MMPL family transporter [Candidatus Treponema equi]
MKSHFSRLTRFSDRTYLKFWVVFHIAVILFFLINFIAVRGNLKIDADLFNMLPKSFAGQSIAKADEKMTALTAQNVFVLVGNKDFAKAKEVAAQVYDQLKDSTKFDSLSLYQDMTTLGDVTDFIHQYRWNLLDSNSVEKIMADGGAAFAEESLAKAFSPFTMMPLDNLDEDPFLLAETGLENYLAAVQSSGTAMTVKDGVLAAESDGMWFVMIRGNLTKEGAALASKKNGITRIYEVCLPLEKDGTRFVFTGTPFHSHKSSNAATREITIISAVSIAAVLVMLLLVFSSPVPILLSLGSITISICTAFAMSIGVFHKLHVLTLIFGTSLIGSCIDYSLHYFINWKGNHNLKSGSEIRSYLFSGLLLSLISTEICFAILLFAPFNLLKQMAVFSLTGILSSFLTVICIYPLVPIPQRRRVHGKRLVKLPEWYDRRTVGRIGVTIMFVFAGICMFTGYKNCKIKNNLAGLYKMEGRVLDDQIEAVKILKYAPRGWFILRDKTQDGLLEKEEAFCEKIKAADGETGLMCTTAFIPSIAKQKKSRQACESLIGLASDQYEMLGYEGMTGDDLRNFFEDSNGFVSMDKVPDFMMKSIASAWLGEIDGMYYSVVFPAQVRNEELFESFAAADEDIFYVSKMLDISRDLDHLTKMILKFFAVAYVIIFVVLRFFYTRKQTFKIISIPLLIILMVASIFSLSKIHLEFFSITGIILVFGLGLDYVIYMVEAERRGDNSEYAKLEPFAILLSFLTTSVSFGALALSSFTPVHLMGLAIFIGLFTAYYSSFFYERDRKPDSL